VVFVLRSERARESIYDGAFSVDKKRAAITLASRITSDITTALTENMYLLEHEDDEVLYSL